MKKIGIFILIAFFAFQVNAQVKSSLTIFSKDGEKFWIVRNGVKQNEKPATSVTVDNIVDRTFKIKVLIDDDKLTSIDQSIYTINVDEQVCNLTYELRKKDKGKYVLRVVSYEPVGSGTTQTQQTTTQQTTTQPTQNQTTTTTQTTNVNPNGVNMTVKDPNIGVDFNVNMNVPVNNQTTTTTHNTTTTQTRTTTNVSSGYMKNGSMCPNPSMNQKAYMDFKYDIESQNMFNRLEYIKSTFSKNCMLAEQVAGIIQLNYPTVDELEVAKYGYRYTWDTENYGVVVKAIKSENKRNDLMSFLNAGTTTSTTITNTTQPNTNQNHQPNTQPHRPNSQPSHHNDNSYNNCRSAMPVTDFEEAKTQIKKASFAEDKMRVAKQVTKANCLSVAQIKEICKLFSFENDKLDYAKFAYDYTFEKPKYYLVNDVFSFSSSREELDEYIQSKQK